MLKDGSGRGGLRRCFGDTPVVFKLADQNRPTDTVRVRDQPRDRSKPWPLGHLASLYVKKVSATMGKSRVLTCALLPSPCCWLLQALRMRSQQTVQLRPRKPHLRPPLLKTKLLKGSSTMRLPRASKSWRTKNSHAPKRSGRRSCVASALDARGWAFVPGEASPASASEGWGAVAAGDRRRAVPGGSREHEWRASDAK